MRTVNFLPEHKCVWWGTSHSASRATASFLISQTTFEVKSTYTREVLSRKTVHSLPSDYEVVKPAAFRHVYSWFEFVFNNENFFLICNIRNPYARIASVWRQDSFLRKNNTFFTFPDYIKNLANAAEIMTEKKIDGKRGKERPWPGPGGFFSIADNINYIYSLYKKKPDLYLRAEKLGEDIKKIPFFDFTNSHTEICYQNYIVKNNTRAKEDEIIRNRIEKNSITDMTNIDPFRNWKYYYDQTTAGTVYNYLKNDFEYFGYNKDSWKESVNAEPAAANIFII